MVMTKPKIKVGAKATITKAVTPVTVAKATNGKAVVQGLTFSPAGHRYRLDGLPVTGVTTLINGGIPKEMLIPWAAEVAGEWAIKHLDELPTMDPNDAIREMKMAWRKIRDDAGVTGTAVHKLAEQLSKTGEVDADEDLLGYIEGFVQFLDDWQISPVLVERKVANRKHHYAGMFDMYATSPFLADGKLVQIDLKTSKGVYGETALQLAAYARAEFYLDDNGVEQPMPEVHATFVAHVTPMDRDGAHARYGSRPLGTTLYPMATSPEQIDEHFQWFLAAAYTAKTKKERELLAREPLELATEMSKAS